MTEIIKKEIKEQSKSNQEIQQECNGNYIKCHFKAIDETIETIEKMEKEGKIIITNPKEIEIESQKAEWWGFCKGKELIINNLKILINETEVKKE